MDCIDFSRSWLFWSLPGSTRLARFALEAALDMDGDIWYLCSTVMAGNVYADTMARVPVYAYTFATNTRHWVRLRDGSGACLPADDLGEAASLFSELRVSVHTKPAELLCGERLFNSVEAGLPLSACVVLDAPRKALLYFPVKHINMHTDGRRWQAETGPVLLPAAHNAAIPVALAALFFNQSGRCEALVRSTANGGQDVFSKPVVLAGKAHLVR